MDAVFSGKARAEFYRLARISESLFVLLVQLFHPPLVFLQRSCTEKKQMLKKGNPSATTSFHIKAVLGFKKKKTKNLAAPNRPAPRSDDKSDLGGLVLLRVEAQQVGGERLPSCSCCSCRFRDASLSWYILPRKSRRSFLATTGLKVTFGFSSLKGSYCSLIST